MNPPDPDTGPGMHVLCFSEQQAHIAARLPAASTVALPMPAVKEMFSKQEAECRCGPEL
jgi:hypothetical protein